ncbi:MAG: phasin family protein [Deltaproteobacteria bacterium]|nr:phasin family protein [Deltaproteobacteria bacterium]
MFREVIEDALHRGEKLKKDIVGQILSSAAFNELVNNKKFTDTVVKIIETKHEIARALHKKIEEILKRICVPSTHDLSSYQRRVEKLENQVDQLSRQSRKPAKGKTRKK